MIKGAEAEIKIADGKILKIRKTKKYRHKDLDKKIREERTKEEVKNIQRARKHNVNVPQTEQKDEKSLEQDRIKGKSLKDFLEGNESILRNVGKEVSKLHSTNIIHGDLTTSNIYITDDREVFIIDFGLSEISERIEDKAVDIHLLKQVLESSHPQNSETAWNYFNQGYKNYEESDKVLSKLDNVESRGRYK